MSWQATAWAAQQRTGSPSGKAVLYSLANHADHMGVCFPSRALIAHESEQSIDTVDRRLAELEEAGLILREKRMRLDGSPTTAKITLCFSPEKVSTMLAAEHDATPREAACDGGWPQIAATPPRGEGGVAASSAARVAASSAARVAAMVRLQEESIEPSIEPSLSARASEASGQEPRERGDQKSIEEEFEALWTSWPNPNGLFARSDCWQAFKRLNGKDRKLAVRMAPAYLAGLKEANRKHAPDPARWLSKRQFEDVAESRQASAVEQGLKHPPVFVRKGTPAWEAWQNRWRRERRFPEGSTIEMPSWWSDEHKSHGAHKPTLFPPRAEGEAPVPGELEQGGE